MNEVPIKTLVSHMADRQLKVRFKVDSNSISSKMPSEFSLQNNSLYESIDNFNISIEPSMTTQYVDHMKPF
jgi:hypothetical protein